MDPPPSAGGARVMCGSVRSLPAAWLLWPRLRRRVLRRPALLPPYEEVFGPYAQGRSFVEVGTMWNVHGRYAFAAEACGATPVTAFDDMAPTPEFEAEHARRSSAVRFVQGDINDAASLEKIGVHDLVWCAGVVYHSPDPALTLRHLCRITGDWLFVASKTIPEVPGLPQASVFLPGLEAEARTPYARVFPRAMGLETPFDRDNWYGNWWWGISPSALRAMVEVNEGIRVVEELRRPFETLLIARRTAPA